MDEERLADVVAGAYEAASGSAGWFEFGASLCQLLGAQRCSLRLGAGSLSNLLAPGDEAEAAYLAYFYRIDPYRRSTEAAGMQAPQPNTARLGAMIVQPSDLRRTEYFTDYAARYGQHHMLGGIIGLKKPLPIGLHRDAASGAFTDVERRALEKILPHLQRALQLRERLAPEGRVTGIGTDALDALSAPIVIVDGALQVRHVNPACTRLMSHGRCGLTVGRGAAGGPHLYSQHRDDHSLLRQLVAGAASGGAGGAMRVRARSDDVPENATLAVLVSPLPMRLLGSKPGIASGLAIIVARELSRPAPVPESILRDLYGLTAAEAAVASALAGGVRAEDVARERRVSLETVRTQVRTVLRKTNAANLRDFERMIGLVSAA